LRTLYCAVVRYNRTFNSTNNTLIRAFATPHYPGDEGDTPESRWRYREWWDKRWR